MSSVDSPHSLLLPGFVRTNVSKAGEYFSPVTALVAVKALGLLTLTVWSWLNDKSAHVLLSARWDSLWYVRVVEHGYDFTLTAEDGRVLSNMAFFPLFPAFEKLVSSVLLISPADAGLVVSFVSSAFAAAGIYAAVDVFTDRRTALLTVILWAALPVAIVQSMAYSESLFTALAAWSLYFIQKNRWTASALLACAAGLTRPVGVAVALAVWAAVLCEVRSSGWSWKNLLGLALAPAGFTGYVLWVGLRTGSLFGYLDVQKEWGNGFDAGLSFCRFVASLLLSPDFLAGVTLCVGLMIVVRTYMSGFRKSYPLSVQLYTGVVVLLALGSSGFIGSKPRLLIPAFSLLIPLATLLLRARQGVRWAMIAAMCAVSASYGAFWLNGSGPP